MKLAIAGVLVALAPLGLSAQSVSVASVIPRQALALRTTVQPAVAAPAITDPATTLNNARGAKVTAAAEEEARPQCNMLVATGNSDSRTSQEGGVRKPTDRAVQILTQRSACVNVLAARPSLDSSTVGTP